MLKVSGSFRDPCGYVFADGNKIIRTINHIYKDDWDHAVSSGLLDSLAARGFLPSYSESEPLGSAWKSLKVEKLPWISYPYEWSFYQLRDAARITLDIQIESLSRGMTLKDASAYNVQFIGSAPVFIDFLSFERRTTDSPWAGYRQFCMQFLAPLALSSYDPCFSRLSAGWIGGIPLNLAWKILPWKAAFSAGMQMHLHLHGKAEKKYGDARKVEEKVRQTTISSKALIELAESLRRTIDSLHGPSLPGDWTDYYSDTNYSDQANTAKMQIVETVAKLSSGSLAHDLGANTGRFSAVMAPYFEQVIASDIDGQAVARHYICLKKSGNKKILPLVLDLSNPSPSIGWANTERMGWTDRGEADLISALALTHHLYFTEGIPWERQAYFFAKLLKKGGRLLVEFVPREDSQVERMLAARDDIFSDYTLDDFRNVMGQHFAEEQLWNVPESCRTLILFNKN